MGKRCKVRIHEHFLAFYHKKETPCKIYMAFPFPNYKPDNSINTILNYLLDGNVLSASVQVK